MIQIAAFVFLWITLGPLWAILITTGLTMLSLVLALFFGGN